MSDRREIRLDSAAPSVRQLRVDRAMVRKVEKTPIGGRRVEAGMVRRGQVLEYRRADGTTVRELVSPEAAAAPVAGAAVTVMHPGGGTRLVSPATFKQDAVGVILGDARFDGDIAVATFDVNDAEAIARVDARDLCEVSLGYVATIVETPGVTADGVRYDAIQVSREVNHAALLPRGAARAGSDATLRLDGAAIEVEQQTNAAPPVRAERTDTMKTERIDGIDYVVGSAEWQQAHARRMARLDEEKEQLEEKVEKQDDELEALKKERDELKAKLADIEKRLGEAESPERMDARVAERTALLDAARGVLGADTKFVRQDGKSAMSDREVRVAVLAKLDPELKLDGQSDDVVRIHFDAATRFATKGAGASQGTAAGSPAASPLSAARAAAVPAPGASPAKRLDARDFTPDLSAKLRR